MNRYFYLHQNHFCKYYPAKASALAGGETCVSFSTIGFSKNVIGKFIEEETAKIDYDGMNTPWLRSHTRSVKIAKNIPETYQQDTLNRWFFDNVLYENTRDRFITEKEQEDLLSGGEFTLNGPSYENLERLFTLLFNFYAIDSKEHPKQSYELGMIAGVESHKLYDVLMKDRYVSIYFSGIGNRAGCVEETILKEYPNLIIVSDQSHDTFQEDFLSKVISHFRIPLMTNPREILHIKKDLLKILTQYNLQKILPKEVFERL